MKILVACGGTGGHIFPALTFLETLKSKQKDLDVTIVITKRKIESRIVPPGYKVAYISLYPLRLSLDGKNLIALIKLPVGILQSIYIILRFHPKVVVGFGGYATFPLVFFAKVFGIKTIIHEQNVMAGVANKILSGFADKIAISFPETREYFESSRDKIILTGNPPRKDLSRVSKKEALDFFGFSPDKFTILVTGGSQGSTKINKVFIEALSGIPDKNRLQVIHLSGTKDFGVLASGYKKISICVKLFEFLKPMHYAYCASDLVISRAGATTISEIIFFGLPAIIIPYPFAYQHQIANARILTDRGAGILIEESNLNALALAEAIADLFYNRSKIESMRAKYALISPAPYEQDLSDAVLT